MGLLALFKRKRLEETSVGDVVVLTPSGNLIGDDETFELQDRFEELVARGNRRLVVNLKNVKYTVMIGFSTLVAGFALYRKADGRFAICCARENVRRIATIVKMDRVLEFYDTEDKAIRSFDAEQQGS